MKKRILSVLLALVMLLSLLPTTVFATDPVPNGITVPYTVKVTTPELDGRIVTAQYYTTTTPATHVPELDTPLICDGRTYDIPNCNDRIDDVLVNQEFWKTMGNSEQANILFVTDDPTPSPVTRSTAGTQIPR